MKRLKSIGAISLAALCTAGFAGCVSSGSSASALSSNWYVRSSYPGIQPSSIISENGGKSETLLYGATFTAGDNAYYSLSYDDGGEMKTEFYADSYDWTDEAVPDGYRAETDPASEIVYVYKTSFAISGAYTFTATGEKTEFSNATESVCFFRSVRNDLQPVYSYQYVKTMSPSSLRPGSKDEMCVSYEYECTTYYNYSCTQATIVYSDLAGGEPQKTVTDIATNEAFFDNASLYTAMRAMTLDSTFSQAIGLLIPVEKRISTYNVSGSGDLTLEDEGIRNALINAGYIEAYTVNDAGESVPTEVAYRSASLTYTGSLPGTVQRVWYASKSDVSNNACRSTMLKIILPASYGLGTLELSLKEIVSHLDA